MDLSEIPKHEYVAGSFTGFPFSDKHTTMVKRGADERGPITFVGIAYSIRIGDAVNRGMPLDNAITLINSLCITASVEKDFLINPIQLSDYAWHKIFNEWMPIEQFVDAWIPPMASGRQIGYLKGLAKTANREFDYLNMKGDEASRLISELKKATQKKVQQGSPGYPPQGVGSPDP